MHHAPHFVGLSPGVGVWPAMPELAASLKHRHNVFCSVRHGKLRVGVYVYSTPEDVARFVAALKAELSQWRSHAVQEQ